MTDSAPTAHSPLPPDGQKNLEAFQALLEVDERERSFKERQGFITAYVLSVLLPPFGIYFCIKYIFFSNRTPDEIRAGLISLGLTVASLLLSVLAINILFSVPGVKPSPAEYDTLKQFVTPANMQQFKDLLQ